MPNTAVKPLYAESTRLETVREDRELPVRKIPHLMDAEFFYVSGQRSVGDGGNPPLAGFYLSFYRKKTNGLNLQAATSDFY